MRLIDFFDKGVALSPGRVCLQDSEVKRTYAEVQSRSFRFANAMSAAGFRPGQKAGLYTPNCAAGLEVMIGLFRSGVVWVPVNAKNPVLENALILDQSDVEILFYHSEFSDSLATIAKQCPQIVSFVCLDRSDGDNPAFEDWLFAASDTDPNVDLDRDSIVGIMSSGGTTGRPKGIVHTQLVWETMIANLFAHVDFGPEPVHLVIAPITHAAGVMAIALLAAGARNVILPGFDAATVLDTIEREEVTHLFLPPTAIYMLLSQPDLKQRRLSSIRGFFYAAAPMAVEKLRECLDIFGPVMIQTFGQAEAPMVCTILTADDHRVLGDPRLEHRLASCGRATLLTPVAIMDDDGRLLPTGERGEIVVRGNLVMKGYYKNEEATVEVSEHGWHHTGDIGQIDEDGFVYIVDRKKDMIISGGFNVYPSEVEQVLWAHPAVQDCAVVGVPDEKWGEAVKAVIELKPGSNVDADMLIHLCKQQLGSVKAPKSVEFWPSLPRTPVGKVSKKEIRNTFWESQQRKI